MAINQISQDVSISVSDGVATGTSNTFDVEGVPSFYQVTSPSYVQTAGDPFQVSVTMNAGATINLWEDEHQDPVLVTTSDVNTLNSNSANAQWTEFLYTAARPYPSILASALHTTGLPTMHFYANGIPNGRYEVIANLYDNAAMRYYYGFTSDDTIAHSVATAGGATGTQHQEYSLGVVEVTDNSFNLYTNYAELISGTYELFGWAWVRLSPVALPQDISVNLWEDDHQDPVLATTTVVQDLLNNSANAQWTEFLYTASRPYPTILASALHTTGLPTMHFYANGIPNGRYEVFANLYDNAAMRYYYGYSEADPRALNVATAGGLATGAQHREYSLGVVEVTDNSFNLYTNYAELVSSGYEMFGWAWIRLSPVINVNLWEDDHQDPVLATTTDVQDLLNNSANAQWTEFLFSAARPYPSIMASALHTAGLPTMHFYANGIPNGRYEAIANVYDNAAMTYFFGYTSDDPRALSVSTTGGATGTQHREYSLGTVDIIDNSFNLYTNYAEVAPGGYDIFGWAWIRLEPQPTITMSSDSPTMLFDADGDGIFGEPGDNLKPLLGGTMEIMALDNTAGTEVSIVATDNLGQAGANTYTIMPALPPEPSFISLDPASGASSVGVPVNFTLTLGDGDGYGDIADVRFVIKEGTGTGTSDDAIVLGTRSGYPDRLYLWDHSTGRWVWALYGSSTILENTNCSVDASQSSITGDGQILTFNFNIIPKACLYCRSTRQ